MDCVASANAGLSTCVGETATVAVRDARAGLAVGDAAGLVVGTAAVCARVGDGRAAWSDGLLEGVSNARGFCVTVGLLVAWRATVDAEGRTSAGVDVAAGAAEGDGAAATAVTLGVASLARR